MVKKITFANNPLFKWLNLAVGNLVGGEEATPADIYKILNMYYQNNGLYSAISEVAYIENVWIEGLKPLRNPAYRAVEFYVKKLWPGALPDALQILTDNPNILEPIEQVWTWSNWGVKKQLAARWYALFGDLVLKVVTAKDAQGKTARVYMQLIRPEYVTDFKTDERDFWIWCRLDVPKTKTLENGTIRAYYFTEVWDKSGGTYQTWEHEKSPQTPLNQLGDPTVNRNMADFGINFLPFVHAQFRDIGEDRGQNVFMHVLDKIDEANRQVTRLHQMLFRYNKPIMGVSGGGNGPDGRPLPPPRIGTGAAGDDVILGDDTLLALPGASTAFSLVPNINYQSALDVLKAHMMELEQDLPELAYYRLRDLGANISGRAIRLLLSDAVDNVLEARGNAETALARAHAMALTIGQNADLFSNIGNYEAGDFDHVFADRPVIPLTKTDQAEVIKSLTSGGVPLVTAAREVGWTDEQIARMEEDQNTQDKRTQDSLAQALLRSQRQFDQGQNPGNPDTAGNNGGQPPGGDSNVNQ